MPLPNPHVFMDDYERKICDSLGFSSVMREVLAGGPTLRKPKLLIFLNPYGGCTDYIRLITPVISNEAMDKKVYRFCLRELDYDEESKSFNLSERLLERFDIAILLAREKISEGSLEALKKLKELHPEIPILLDLDDDLFSIQKGHPDYEFYAQRLELQRELIELCDSLVLSTDVIRDRLEEAHCELPPAITIIPNYLDSRIWDIETPIDHEPADPQSIRVLFAGSETHGGDLMLLQEPLKRAAAEVKERTGKDLKMIVVGGTEADIPGMEIIECAGDNRNYPVYAQWIQGMEPFDFAVAPLELDRPLNHAKSYLKYLEYSAIGLPGIYTDIEPYAEVIENGKNGILIPRNDPELWKDAIVSLAVDPDLRLSIAQACRDDIIANHLLKDHYHSWYDVFENALANRAG